MTFRPGWLWRPGVVALGESAAADCAAVPAREAAEVAYARRRATLSGRDLLKLSDTDLVRLAVDGDTEAFHTLTDRYAKDLFRLAVSLSSSRADAEDICQETLIGAFRSLHRFEGKASVKTWLMRILMRRAAKHWHKGRDSRKTLSIHAPDDTGRSSDRQDGLPTTPSASGAVDHRIDLRAVIQKLAPGHREVILLREMQGMSYEEIAATLQIPRGTVESRLFRARGELRELLKDYLP